MIKENQVAGYTTDIGKLNFADSGSQPGGFGYSIWKCSMVRVKVIIDTIRTMVFIKNQIQQHIIKSPGRDSQAECPCLS